MWWAYTRRWSVELKPWPISAVGSCTTVWLTSSINMKTMFGGLASPAAAISSTNQPASVHILWYPASTTPVNGCAVQANTPSRLIQCACHVTCYKLRLPSCQLSTQWRKPGYSTGITCSCSCRVLVKRERVQIEMMHHFFTFIFGITLLKGTDRATSCIAVTLLNHALIFLLIRYGYVQAIRYRTNSHHLSRKQWNTWFYL